MTEESKNQENITEESPVSAPPKQEIVENFPVAEEIPTPSETPTEEQVTTPTVEEVEISSLKTSPRGITSIPLRSTEERPPSEVSESQPITPTQEVETPQPTEPIQEVKQSQLAPAQEVPNPVQQSQTSENEISTSSVVPPSSTPPRGTTFSRDFVFNLLNKARAKIQERKRNKLDKIMLLFESNPNISNSDIQKLLRTTKRSATRYLNILEKEQKIIQVGNKGRGVKYVRK